MAERSKKKPTTKRRTAAKRKTTKRKASPKTKAAGTEDQPKNKGGRPSKYTDKMANEFCALIASGMSARKICETVDGMPSLSMMFRYLSERQEFREQYARAMESRSDAMFEEMIDIADCKVDDTFEDDKGHIHINFDVIQRDRLRVETRKWALSRMNPKKYGDSIKVGGDEDNPLHATITTITRTVVKADAGKRARA